MASIHIDLTTLDPKIRKFLISHKKRLPHILGTWLRGRQGRAQKFAWQRDLDPQDGIRIEYPTKSSMVIGIVRT